VAEPFYEIRVEGEVSPLWCEWFEDLSIRDEAGPEGAPRISVLVVHSSDPARLHGVLAQIGNLNLKLISVLWKE
jgi:hypothetical protein